MPHLFKSPYRARNTVRFREERASEPGSQRIRRAVHDYRPSRLDELVQRRLQRNRRLFLNEYRDLYNRLRDRFRRNPFCYTLARPLRAAAYCCPASCCTAASCRSHRFRSSFAVCLSRECILQPIKTFSSQGLSLKPTLKPLKPVISGARQCACRCACCAGSSCPTSGTPTAFADDCPLRGLHHHRAGDPRDSSPHRELLDECPSSGCVRLSRKSHFTIEGADLANRRHAIDGELAHFAGRQLDQRQIAFFAQQLRGSSRGAHQLAATARIQLDVV